MQIVDQSGRPVGKPVELPSVTTILKAMPKAGMEWWGYKMGLEAVKGAVEQGLVDPALLTVDELYEEIKKHGRAQKVVTPSNNLKQSASRGTDIHDVAEKLFRGEPIPGKSQIPQEQHGYIEALLSFHETVINELKMEVVAVEVPLFSLTHRYAGTTDLILRTPSTIDSATGEPSVGHAYQVIDFKTSKAIYESHTLQSTAYKHAAIEQGYVPEDAICEGTVVRLGEKGKYQLKNSSCSLEDFLDVKKMWEFLDRQKVWTG